MTSTQEFTGLLEVVTCSCGVVYGLDVDYIKERRKDHKIWRCPNGCSRYFPQDNEVERLRRENAALERRAANAIERAALADRQRAAAKGAVTKLKNRAAAGMCPCCKRSFVALAAHIASQHPTFNQTTSA